MTASKSPWLTKTVIFACLEWGSFQNFESASLTFTSVAIILPMGGLVAQRVSLSGSRAAASSQKTDRTAVSASAMPFAGYQGLHSGSSRFGTTASVSRIDSAVSKEKSHPLEAHLEQLDREEEGQVRVERGFGRQEEKA